ncbi:hypothetical protein GMORB2_1081, partial [Geosmithia morbida]
APPKTPHSQTHTGIPEQMSLPAPGQDESPTRL